MDSCTSSGRASRRHRAVVGGRDGDVEPSSAFNEASVLLLTTSICASALTAAARGARRMDGARSSDLLWLGRRLVNQQVNSSANPYRGDVLVCVEVCVLAFFKIRLCLSTNHHRPLHVRTHARATRDTRRLSLCSACSLTRPIGDRAWPIGDHAAPPRITLRGLPPTVCRTHRRRASVVRAARPLLLFLSLTSTI